MTADRVLMFAAALCVTAAVVDADQGRGAPRGSGRGQAPVPRGAVQEPKADRPARGERADRPARGTSPDRTIAANIAKDPKLDARVKAMLPPGMTLEQASDGFRNQGQFVAALQASKNLDINFADLKAEMTGAKPLTLGEAIQKLKP